MDWESMTKLAEKGTILADHEILRLAYEKKMISPYVESAMRHDKEGNRVLSYGPSSYGYDTRLGSKFKVFTNVYTSVVDPKNFSPNNFIDMDASRDGYVIIPPNSFALGQSYEYYRIPRDILVICLGKSTYARCGIIVNVTPLEPCWEGHVTLEFSNTTPLPAKLYANEGCAQFIFHRVTKECTISYADKGGKYQKQVGVTPPKM
jgi:dCTP deaminase